MKKRVSAGFCLLLCSIVFSLGGCGSTTSVSEMTSQDAQSHICLPACAAVGLIVMLFA